MPTVKLGLMPLWNPEGGPKNVTTHVALIIQAYHTAAYVQKVTIAGPGIPGPGSSKTVESDPSKPMGSAFWSEEINMTPHVKQSVPLYFDVTIQYKKDNQWQEPAVLAVQGTPMGPSCVTACAFANDSGDDTDYNDTVVTLSLFPFSRDP